MLIFGWGNRKTKNYGRAYPTFCENCLNESDYAVLKSRDWFTLFFVPVIPYRTQYWITCPICGAGYELETREEKRKAVELAETAEGYAEGEVSEEGFLEAAREFEAAFVGDAQHEVSSNEADLEVEAVDHEEGDETTLNVINWEGKESEVGDYNEYYIVDDTPEETLERGGLGDFRLIIGPHPENEKPVIHRSNRPTNIPEGSLLHIQNKGNLIQIPPKKPFRANVAQLVLPEELDVETHVENDNVVPFPERLTGVDIPEKDRLREDFLEQMLMSIEMQS